MIKYSLVLLTAAAVIFSVGCDGECCGTPSPTAVILGLTAGQSVTTDSFTLSDGGSHDNNEGGTVTNRKWTVNGEDAQAGDTLSIGTYEVCLLVTDNDGLTNQTCGTVIVSAAANPAPVASVTAPATCTPNSQVDISGSGTDNGSIASYSWTPSSITGQSGEITCPASGSITVCLTVTDDEDKESSPACKTINATAATCPTPVITASLTEDNPTSVGVMNFDQTYYLGYQAALDACDPAKTCTWTVRSMDDEDNRVNVADCFTFQDGDHGAQTGVFTGTWVKLCDSGNDYDHIEVNLTCTGMDTVSISYEVQ